MGVIDGLIGIWFIVVPFLGMSVAGNIWSNVIGGIIAIIFGFGIIRRRPARAWIIGVLGIWMIVAALFIPVLRMGGPMFWNNIIVGVITAISGFSAMGGRQPSPAPQT